MKKLYIRFSGDNKYCKTMLFFVKAIAPRIFYKEWKNITKEQIVELFNKTSLSLYYLCQNENQFMNCKHIEEYLKIETKDIMFEDESDEFFYSGQSNGDGCLATINHNYNIEYTVC